MTVFVRAELTQIRTLRSTYGVLALVVVLTLAIIIGDFSESGKAQMDSPGELRDALARAGGLVTAIVFTVFAATRTAAEYRHATIGQRVLAAPRRWPAVVSKLIGYGGLAALMGALTVAFAFPLARAVASNKGVSFDPSAGDLAGVAGGTVAAAVLFAAVGVAVGFLTRNPTTAILTLLGTFFLEQLFASQIGDVAHYMPYALLDSVLDVGLVAPLTAGLALAGIATAATTAAVVLLGRRDVQ